MQLAERGLRLMKNDSPTSWVWQQPVFRFPICVHLCLSVVDVFLVLISMTLRQRNCRHILPLEFTTPPDALLASLLKIAEMIIVKFGPEVFRRRVRKWIAPEQRQDGR